MKFHQNLFNKYVEGVLEFKEANVSEPVPVGDFNAVQSLCTLYDAFRDNPLSRWVRVAEDTRHVFLFPRISAVVTA